MRRRRAMLRRRPVRGDPLRQDARLRRESRRESGMVTAEIATALPVLVALVVAAVWTVTAASAQTRCVDAAREGARAAARGENDAVVTSVTKASAPDGARVQIARNDGTVTVYVEAHLPLPPPFTGTGPTVHGKAVALSEP